MSARLALALAMVVAGCRSAPADTRRGPRELLVTDADSANELVSIRSASQSRLSDGLRIAAGNFWAERYTDASGAEIEGLTCALWISATDTSPVEHVRVHPGQALKLGEREGKVVAIDADVVRLSVR